MKLEDQRPLATQARDMLKTGASKAEVLETLGVDEVILDTLVDWAEEFVPAEVPTARQAEIAAVNRQQAELFRLWSALPEEERTLELFKLFNREFLELSKARRALGGLDAPQRTEKKVDPNWDSKAEDLSIDEETARLTAKLKLNDKLPGARPTPDVPKPAQAN